MSLIQNPIPKQAIVGSLLICPIDSTTWYRVVGENRKIIKMERIKGSTSVSYRCTVFDIGAMIEILLENCNQDEFQTYGPVKFDNYLSKQLEISITNNSWFSANLHMKINQTISVKIRVAINEKGALQVHIQTKKQEICIKIPYKENWRMYEDIFSIENIKLTEICLKNAQILEENKNQSVVHRVLRERKYVLITFLNVVQRNILLAQIVLKTKDRQLTIKRLSQLKIEQKNLDNQVQKLFQSNISSNQFRMTQLSQKVINDFQEVVFTPSMDNEQNHDKQFCSLFFDQFLNPENKKEPFVQKLSQIQQQEGEGAEKIPSSSHINQNLKKSNRKITKPFLQKAETQRKKTQQQSIDQIMKDHKTLLEQNQKLKRQNKMLRMKLSKKNLKTGETKYQLPLFFRNSSRNIKLTNEKPPIQFSHKNKLTHRQNNWNSQKIFFSQLQSPKSFSKQKHSDSTDKMRQLMIQSRKKQLMSMSTKTLRYYFHGHDSFNKSK